MKSFFIREHEVKVDDDVFEWASKMSWTIDKSGNTFYARNVKGRLHRLVSGLTASDIVLDHINGNGLDNRRMNLRACTVKENNRNCKKEFGTTSQYKGVSWKSNRGKWQAQIKVDGKVKYLGLFSNEMEAALAYNKAAKEFHHSFASINIL